MISAEPSEIVNERLAVKFNWKVLFEAELELFNIQKSISVVVNLFDWLPDASGAAWLADHVGYEVLLVDLDQAFKFIVLDGLVPFLLQGNQVVNSPVFAGQLGWD